MPNRKETVHIHSSHGPFATLLLWAVSACALATPAPIAPLAGLYQLDAFDAATFNPPFTHGDHTITRPLIPFVVDADKVRNAVLSYDPKSKLTKFVLLSTRNIKTGPSSLLGQPIGKGDAAMFGLNDMDVTGLGFMRPFGSFCQAWSGQLSGQDDGMLDSLDQPGFCGIRTDTQITAVAGVFRLFGEYRFYTRADPGTEYGHVGSQFSLSQARDYSDILFLPRKAALHDAPSLTAALSSKWPMLPKGSYVARHGGDSKLADGTELIQVDVLEGDGQTSSGWLDLLDALPGEWVTQKSQTKEYRFQVSVILDASENGNNLQWNAILAINKKTGAKQLIQGGGDGNIGPANALLSMVDANFDGYPDIAVRSSDGGAGPNSSDEFYLFDPDKQRFIYHQQLSQLTQVAFDEKHKTIQSATRDGCCAHYAKTFRYVGTKLTEIANWEQRWEDDKHVVETTCVLRLGTFRCNEVKRKTP